ncbi:MAG: M20 family metallo-hydrolase [Rubrivivax sp.]|nr:M20 family metallo-hydrolase [Rubrivivax sp.]
MSTKAAAQVSETRLWQRLMQIARHGATPRGGVNRQALSAEEIAAWRDMIDWASALGLMTFTDSAGNLFLRLEGTDPGAAPVLTGSHLDSQPTGGKFDGVYGVLASLEAVQAIVETELKLKRSIEVVSWMNEEGSRFAPGMMGSAAFSGAASMSQFLPVRDAAGISVSNALQDLQQAFPALPRLSLQRPVSAYVETHIEQGPILEREGFPVGVVTGIQGKLTYRVIIEGFEAHCGTTPRSERKDALLAAARAIQALDLAMTDAEDQVRFTVGRLEVRPNAPSVIAGSAVFSIDMRHPDSAELMALGARIAEICELAAAPCSVRIESLTRAESLQFPQPLRDLIRTKAAELNIPAMDIYSAAGHDARFLHQVCPSAMIFVPCRDGISHNEAESAEPGDLAAGARVLSEVLVELAAR